MVVGMIVGEVLIGFLSDEGQREKIWLAVGLSKTHGILV